MTTDLSFRDFSLTEEDAKPKTFKVDGDTFCLPAVIAPVMLGELIESAKGLGGFSVADQASVEAALQRDRKSVV